MDLRKRVFSKFARQLEAYVSSYVSIASVTDFQRELSQMYFFQSLNQIKPDSY